MCGCDVLCACKTLQIHTKIKQTALKEIHKGWGFFFLAVKAILTVLSGPWVAPLFSAENLIFAFPSYSFR